MRRAARKDANHGEVCKAFVACGCTVADLASCGLPGFPDIIAGIAGKNVLVEIKNLESRYGKKGLNPNQIDFASTWRGGPVHVVTSTADVIALVNKERANGVG